MNNKACGSRFERIFARMLAMEGFWVHVFQDNRNGQPFDVIAVKNGKAFVFDCKACTGKTFRLSRMEANQISAMKRWEECGNLEGAFAVRYATGNIYILPFQELMSLRSRKIKSLDEQQAGEVGRKWN